MTRDVEIAWAAGLFEGEGSISRTRERAHLRLSLSSTDRDVIERFASIVGCGSMGGWQGAPPRKFTHQWYVDGENAERVLRLLLPQLGGRRTAKAMDALAARAEFIAEITKPRECHECGHVFQPRLTAASKRARYCSTTCLRIGTERTRTRRKREQRASQR